jgi:hypothetical protein
VAIGSLAGGEQSATQPPEMLHAAKRLPPASALVGGPASASASAEPEEEPDDDPEEEPDDELEEELDDELEEEPDDEPELDEVVAPPPSGFPAFSGELPLHAPNAPSVASAGTAQRNPR